MFRIMIAGFKLETNSFSEQPTTLSDYQKRSFLFGEEVREKFTGTRSELGAFLELSEKRDDVEIIPVIDANTNPGGPITREAYEAIQKVILEGYQKAAAEGGVDGILLALHGAMVTETGEDGEGELLMALREVTGPDLPIMCTLDFHANMTEEMVENATALFISRYYPHTDFYERGLDAADLMMKVLRKEAHPAAAMKRMPLIYPHIPTSDGPMPALIEDLIGESRQQGIYYAYFVAGFSRADISIQGSSIYCVTEADRDLAEGICRKYSDRVVGNIHAYGIDFPDPAEACAEALKNPGLTVLADAADNPGSGLSGDATELVRLLAEAGAGASEGTYEGHRTKGVAVGTIWDPETVEEAWKAGPGATIHVRLGGKSNPIVGAPLEIDAYVQGLSDGNYRVKGPMVHGVWQKNGPSATLLWNGFAFVVISNRTQTYDLEVFRHNGIEPLDYHIIVVKSAVHFRAAYRLLDAEIVALDMPNLTSFDERKVPYRHVPRPIYPLDEIGET